MPSHGVDIIDGIPVILKDGIMYACQPGLTGQAQIKLGTYIASTKKATWEASEAMQSWLTSYRENLVSRSRK